MASVLIDHCWACMCIPLKLAESKGKSTGKPGTGFLAHNQNKLLILYQADREVASVTLESPVKASTSGNVVSMLKNKHTSHLVGDSCFHEI